ncbi:MAG: mannose-1-phosphate guanylyltransferase/mannose-6-phosphate isomerase [Thiohalomonadaceae bacterium]
MSGVHIQPVILSGGSGTRLWPLSRTQHPKQFLTIGGAHSLFQETVARLQPLDNILPPMVMCNHEHRFMVVEQLRQIGVHADIFLEQVGRNTAPAVAIAALATLEQGDAPLLVAPADHAIHDPGALIACITSALPAVLAGRLVTFGITPAYPATGFGYIKPAAQALPDQARVFPVEAFKEKPDLDMATHFCRSGEYFWNSGIFMFMASAFLAELARHAPEVEAACRRGFTERTRDLDFVRIEPGALEACPGVSIDCAVMEHTDRACMIALDAGWNDLGTWAALAASAPPDAAGNVAVGDVIQSGTRNCYLRAESRLIAAIGVNDQVIVETPDAVLVASKEKAAEVKSLVQQLKLMGRPEADQHRRVYRPWGFYEGIASAERFQAKRILVKVGASLSLQKHHHRAEHWVVVRGCATVTCGDRTFLLNEDQSTYVPVGEVHRLANHGKIPLELIEVQTGSYLGEDDIIRLDDSYGR